MKKGFTLVELLVVIVIIAIILTITFAGFSNSQKDAKDLALSYLGNTKEEDKFYLLLQVWYENRPYQAKIPLEIIEVTIRGDGKDYTTLSGRFYGYPDNRWISATIFVPNSEDKQIWDDYLKSLKSQTPQAPKRVIPKP